MTYGFLSARTCSSKHSSQCGIGSSTVLGTKIRASAAPHSTNRHGTFCTQAEDSQRNYRQSSFSPTDPENPDRGNSILQLGLALKRFLLSSCSPPLASSEFCDVSVVYPNPCLYIASM